MNYNTHTLSNGLRIIQLPSASPVVYCGYAVAAGTRDEQPGREGMAHFCEHITFKGTERRSSMKILGYLESVGGDLNAFTNKRRRSIMQPYCATISTVLSICSQTSCFTAPIRKRRLTRRLR